MQNVKLRTGYGDEDKANWVPTKRQRYRKIDGFAALLDAHTLMLGESPLPTASRRSWMSAFTALIYNGGYTMGKSKEKKAKRRANGTRDRPIGACCVPQRAPGATTPFRQ